MASSVDDYLNTSYEHDMEFVDGVLVERGMPTPAHAVFQALIGDHLMQHRKQFHYAVLLSCRVELVKQSRYRIPDVLVCSVPVAPGKVLTTVPLAVVEIWSPDDQLGRQMQRFREYWTRGVRQILVLDPEAFVITRYRDGALTEEEVHDIELPDGARVPFPASALFNELQELMPASNLSEAHESERS